MITFDIPLWQVFALLASTVFPLIVGLVTKRTTDPGRKAIFLAALAVLTQLAAELAEALQHGTNYNLGTALLLGLTSFLIAVGIHYGLWKPTGVTAKAQAALVTAPQTVKPAPEHVLSAEEARAETDRVPGPDHRA